MANVKITELPELAATPDDADIIEIVDDVAGTPTSKKITVANLKAASRTLEGDLDGQGNYAVDLQNFPDMLAGRGPGYYLNGVDAKVTVVDSDNLSFGNGVVDSPFSAIFTVKNLDSTEACNLLNKGTGGTNREYFIQIDNDDKFYARIIDDSSSGYIEFTSGETLNSQDAQTVLACVYDGSATITGMDLYKNGKPLTSIGGLSGAYTAMENEGEPLFIGTNGTTAYGKMEQYSTKFFNLGLSYAEVKAFSNGAPILYKYLGASKTALTSGTLTIGKQYIIDTFVAGDDFTNVGAASNASGVVFIATGTTPTTWTNSSSLRHEGCVLNLNESGIGHNTWQDVSENSLHGIVSGALPINTPADHSEKYIDLTVTGDTSFTLPKDYIIDSIVLESSGAIGGGIDIGTTNGGGEIVTAQAVAGAGKVLCTLVAGANYNLTGADDTIYITDADASGWDAATVAFTIKMSRLEI